MQLKPVPVRPNEPSAEERETDLPVMPQLPMPKDPLVAFDDGMANLRKPFPRECYGKLPKGGASLDYVGHAAVTDRLLTVDKRWNWEPLAFDADGLPRFTRDANGKSVGLWIRLTVLGVTRLGFGTVLPNAFDAEKQLIGDALRNAAMRFGVALDLWSKDELESELPPKPAPKPAGTLTDRLKAKEPAKPVVQPAGSQEVLAPLPPKGDPQATAPMDDAETPYFDIYDGTKDEHDRPVIRSFQFSVPPFSEWSGEEIGGRKAELKDARWSELWAGDKKLVDVARGQVAKSWAKVAAGGQLLEPEKRLLYCLAAVDEPSISPPFEWGSGPKPDSVL